MVVNVTPAADSNQALEEPIKFVDFSIHKDLKRALELSDKYRSCTAVQSSALRSVFRDYPVDAQGLGRQVLIQGPFGRSTSLLV